MSELKWSQRVLEVWQKDDVEQRLDEIIAVYRKWTTICVAILAGGAAMMLTTKESLVANLGLFVMLTGMVNFAVTRIWIHIRIATLRIVWEMQKTSKDD